MAEKRGRKPTDKTGNDRPTGGPGRPQAPKRPGSAGRPTGIERRPAADRPSKAGRSSGAGRPAVQVQSSKTGRPVTPRSAARPRSAPRPAPLPKRDDSPQAVLALYRPDLAKTLAAADAPSFRYAQVLEHLMRRPGIPLAEASNLPGNSARPSTTADRQYCPSPLSEERRMVRPSCCSPPATAPTSRRCCSPTANA